MSKPRVLFLRPVGAIRSGTAPSKHFVPVPPRGNSIDALNDLKRISGKNVGNFIHTEALSLILDYDEPRSCVVDLGNSLKTVSMKNLAEEASREFDCVIFSTANFIKEGANLSLEVSFLKKLTIPVYIFGAGIQSAEVSRSDLDKSIIDLLEFMDSDGALMATRGDVTQQKLHDFGLRNAVSLGCPSLFVFPDGIESISPPDVSRIQTVVTASHIAANAGPGKRFATLHQFLAKFPRNVRLDYIFQNEVFWGEDSFFDDAIYNTTSKCFDREWIAQKFFKKNPMTEFRIDNFRIFFDTSAWRLFASLSDLYIGDRFHGGVALLQAGKPAVIVRNDDRVAELTGKHAIPSILLADLEKFELNDFFEEYLSAEAIGRMKRTISANRQAFVLKCEERGLLVRKR